MGLQWCWGSAVRAVLVWLGLPCWWDRTDPLPSTGCSLRSGPGGMEKVAEVICWEGVFLSLGQVRRDKLRASWTKLGSRTKTLPKSHIPQMFPKHCREIQCMSPSNSVQGKCQETQMYERNWLPLHAPSCHFRRFPSSFRVLQDLLPYRASSLRYSAQQNLAALNIFFHFFKSSYPLHPQCECKATHQVRK